MASGSAEIGRAPFASAPRLAREVERRIRNVLFACGVSEHEVTVALRGSVSDLVIEIDGPGALQDVRHSLAVRTLDAVHAHGLTFGSVTVLVPAVRS